MDFNLISSLKPAGDQPEAIKSLFNGLKNNKDKQTLLGVTGSGKTFTIANIIQKTQLPTLIISHNKTLAAQLYQEFKELFPEDWMKIIKRYEKRDRKKMREKQSNNKCHLPTTA